mmetsp:Transcript_130209/g.324657  ORF Transcript_130209/g.324657 Transcript_130209/m.324657 type:complete len:248 (+) Transcript_130209:205-948(+)
MLHHNEPCGEQQRCRHQEEGNGTAAEALLQLPMQCARGVGAVLFGVKRDSGLLQEHTEAVPEVIPMLLRPLLEHLAKVVAQLLARHMFPRQFQLRINTLRGLDGVPKCLLLFGADVAIRQGGGELPCSEGSDCSELEHVLKLHARLLGKSKRSRCPNPLEVSTVFLDASVHVDPNRFPWMLHECEGHAGAWPPKPLHETCGRIAQLINTRWLRNHLVTGAVVEEDLAQCLPRLVSKLCDILSTGGQD